MYNIKAAKNNIGYYVATDLTNAVQIGYERFEIIEDNNEIVIKAKHTIQGKQPIIQYSHFRLSKDWTPNALEIDVDGQSLYVKVEFGNNNTIMFTKSKQGDHETKFPIGKQNVFFLLNGGLYFPLLLVRKFNFKSSKGQTFNIIPEGIGEIRYKEVLEEEDVKLTVLEMKIALSGMEDVLHLYIDESMNLIRYRVRNNNLLVKLVRNQARYA